MAVIEDIVQAQYDRLASIYDRRWHFYTRSTLGFLLEWHPWPSEGRILDVACGTGELEWLICQSGGISSGAQIIGVDLSEQMLSVARQKCAGFPQISFITALASHLPFEDESMDLVISANAFHYFPEPIQVLQEMKRVLKPDGSIVILDWCRDYLMCQICDVILTLLDPGYRQCYTESECAHLLNKAQLTIHRSSRRRFGLIWGLMVVSARKD